MQTAKGDKKSKGNLQMQVPEAAFSILNCGGKNCNTVLKSINVVLLYVTCYISNLDNEKIFSAPVSFGKKLFFSKPS